MTKIKSVNDKLAEQDIRPSELMHAQHIAMISDIGRLLFKRKEFVTVSCPACGSDQFGYQFEKRGFDYVECRECQTLYINPRPGPEVLQWFYRESENYAYWNKFIFPASEKARRERIVVPRVNQVLALCQKYGVRTTSLLEVGAGFGTFCIEIQERQRFKRIVAVEPTPDLAKSCRDKGIETIELPVERIKFEASELFNVVVSFEVIEHLFSPRDFVTRMRDFLCTEGLLVLSCPNGQGFDIQTLGMLSNAVDHEHLNYFNPLSLTRLLDSIGFKVLESFTPGKLDAELVRNKILSGEFDVSRQPFLKRVLIDEWEQLGQEFQDFLIRNGMSSNMWIVAQI